MKMSGNLITLLFVIGLLIGGAYFVQAYHFVNTRNGFKFYPKKELTLVDTYADLTTMTTTQMCGHKALARAVADVEQVH